MTKDYQALPTVTLAESNTYTHPEAMPELVHFSDKAMELMVDFEKVKPAIAHPEDLIDDTLINMKASGRHVMLVVNEECVVGAVSSGDLQGEKPLKIAQESRVPRKEIKVAHVMTKQKDLLSIDYQTFRFAKIGEIIKTLRHHTCRYALILDIDEKTQEQRVHGLINIYDIIKRMDQSPGSALHEARSVLELHQTID